MQGRWMLVLATVYGQGRCKKTLHAMRQSSGHTCSHKFQMIQEGVLILISRTINYLSRTELACSAGNMTCRTLFTAGQTGCMSLYSYSCT